jgi:DNA processing protein
LVQNADDIVQDLTTFRHIESDPMLFDGISEPFTPFEFANDDNVQNNLQDTIVGHLSHTPIHVDELVRICTVSVGQLQTVLLDMELAGTVHRHPGNRVSKAA